MYAERNSRLLQGPASDRIHRLSQQCRTECDLMSKKDNQSLRGQTLRRESTSHGITLSRHDVLEASHTRRASPLLAGCPLESLPARAIQLPDKEFRYLRTVIVTAAVYRGLGSRLRPRANHSP